MVFLRTRMLQAVLILLSIFATSLCLADTNPVNHSQFSSKVITNLSNKEVKVASKVVGIHRSILSDIIPQLALALGFVLIIIFAGAYLNKKLGFFNKLTNNKLSIEAVLPLSNKNKLLLVNVENKKYLLGVTQDVITKIDIFENATNETNSSGAVE